MDARRTDSRPTLSDSAGGLAKQGGSWRRRLACLWLTAVLVHAAGCQKSQSTVPSPEHAERGPVETAQMELIPFPMPRVENPGYVGPQACAECHQGRVEECLSSSHFRTCRTPDPSSMPPGFAADRASFELPDTDVRFEMHRRGEQYFQSAIRKDSPTLPPTESTIDLILGAGKNSDEVYLSWHNDNSLWELPVAWVYANDCWGASGFDRNSSGDYARNLTLRCFECHNTWFEHVPGTLSEYRREDLVLGVTCERCHGPGREHVEFHRSHPDAPDSQHIVLPTQLPRERLLEVCTQCHGNAIRHRGPALSYRPGEALEDHYRWVDPPHPEDDHVANQIKYLRQSKCFQASEMTCITCHDPHLTDEPATGSDFASNCTACHQPDHCLKQPELPLGVRDQCVDCHMRKHVKINVNFDLVDDSYVPPARRAQHRIEVDPTATDEVLLRWHRGQPTEQDARLALELEERLLSNWLAEAEAMVSVGRYRAAIAAVREALLVQPEASAAKAKLTEYVALQRQLDADLSAAEVAMRNNQDARAQELFERILQTQPDNALVLGKLGTLAAKQGDMPTAKKRLRRVAELDPDEQYGVSMLAWFAMLEKDYATAAQLYEQADAIEPFNAKIQQLWGESLARAGRFEEALEHYQTALRSDPRQLEALKGSTLAAAATQNFQLALQYATQAVQLTEYRSLGELKTLAELHWQMGQDAEAQSVVAHMLTLTQGDPQLASELRAWAASASGSSP